MVIPMWAMSEHMRKCDIFYIYVHEDCMRLTKNDEGSFTCPNCEYFISIVLRRRN